MIPGTKASEAKVELPPSERAPWPGAERVGSVEKDEIVRVTVVLRRRRDSDLTGGGNVRVTRDAFANAHGADEAGLEEVLRLARYHGLSVENQSATRRAIVLTGPAAVMAEAFRTELATYRTRRGAQFRGRIGPLMVPASLGARILAVLGLDNRRAARSRARTVETPGSGFTPVELAGLYEFPSDCDGSGQTIGIVSLGGGYLASDIKEYFSALGLNQPEIEVVEVDGGRNEPGTDDLADREVTLDIQVAGAMAPGAHIVVYFVENSEQGLYDALSEALHGAAHASAISLSWGGPEETWTSQLRSALGALLDDAAALGVTVTAAAGDDGAADGIPTGLHVDLPACLLGVLGCGGTRLEIAGGKMAESVWKDDGGAGSGATGGGVSRFIALPDWQAAAGVPAHPETRFRGRGVPDVAANADPLTGYRVRIKGEDQVVGGTSAVAPLWAALIARINQKLGRSVGFVNPLLYGAAQGSFRDIAEGDNQGFRAGGRWDACTGLGSPVGESLARSLPVAVRTAANTTGTAS